ncbi:hypothetical protein [Sporosarcina sp. A2]|uniref:hypothetical protein n=1 Tax=Sporosarcina sp. A2 TaxID=3393449 RepID=UPI003D794CA3
MNSEDVFALSLYIPLILLLGVIEITLGAYAGVWSKKRAAAKLLLNMSWTCTLVPLFLNIPLLTRMVDSLYEGRPKTGSPISGDGYFWFSAAIVFLLILVNTLDIYQSYQLAANNEMETEKET